MDLGRTMTEHGMEVGVTTGEGRTSSHRHEHLPSGEEREVNIDAAGLETITQEFPDGSVSTTLPDGTTSTATVRPDPRFGMQAAYVARATVSTAGRTLTLERELSVSLGDPGDPLSLTQAGETTVTNGRVSTKVWTAPGTLTTKTPAGRTTVYTFDPLGRMSTADIPGFAPVQFAYDNRSRLVTATVGTGSQARTLQYGYDALGFLNSVTDPLLRTTSFGHDANGRVTRGTLPDGRSVLLAFDANGNTESVSRPAHEFAWSAVDQLLEYVPPAASPAGPTTYNYNLDRQPVQELRPDGESIEVTYGSGGRLQSMITPRGTYTISYDGATGQMTAIAAPGGATRSYDADLRVSSRTVAGAAPVNYQVDKLIWTQALPRPPWPSPNILF